MAFLHFLRLSIMFKEIDNYYPINLGILRLDTIRNFDIFLRVKNDNLVLYHAGGERFTATVRDNLLDNKVTKLYIRKQDRLHCQRYIEENLSDILTDTSLSLIQRTTISHQSLQFIAQSLFDSPRAKNIRRLKSAVSSTIDLILSDENVLSHLIHITSHDFTTFTHSVNVGIFALGLATNLLESESDHNIKAIAAGFFLHDIGKCLITPEILNKRGPYTDYEWKIMKRHPSDGFKILNKYNALTDESKVIVLQHHERHDGKGYPKGLGGDKIHIYSKICCIADVFDALTSTRPHKRAHTSFNALKIMRNEMQGEFDPEFFARFVMLFSQKKYEV